ncbi:MAG: GNAT family N-acetyltransferase [Acholeplasmataceae bacterium]
MKTLETNRLILRSLKLSDLDDFYNYAKKPTIGPMAGWTPHKDLDESRHILKLMIHEKEVWGITLKPTDRLVGTIGLHKRSLEHALLNKKEIGFVLDDTLWGQGLMVEAVSAVLAYAFNDLKLSKVTCGHRTDNPQSKRVIEKSGFTYTHDEIRDDHHKKPVTIVMYELKKKTYGRLHQ